MKSTVKNQTALKKTDMMTQYSAAQLSVLVRTAASYKRRRTGYKNAIKTCASSETSAISNQRFKTRTSWFFGIKQHERRN